MILFINNTTFPTIDAMSWYNFEDDYTSVSSYSSNSGVLNRNIFLICYATSSKNTSSTSYKTGTMI